MSRSKIFSIIALVAVILLIGSWTVYFYKSITKQTQVYIELSTEQKIFPFSRLLDGKGVETKEEVNRRPVAVMIDNSSDARPVVGIENAVLVYETIAEGAITRILALFDPADLPEKIGPVRSLRPYYLVWALESDAVIAHVGGSPEALRKVEQYDNINEFFSGTFFYRDNNRAAPHNTFTSGDDLREASDFYNYATTTNFISWEYRLSTTTEVISMSKVALDFSIDQYQVEWEFDKEQRRYKRHLGSVLQKSIADNVIIQIVPAQVIDVELRRRVGYIGSGKAWVMHEGILIQGKWEKKSESGKTYFTDSDGRPILLIPGTTWIEILDDEGRVKFNSL